MTPSMQLSRVIAAVSLVGLATACVHTSPSPKAAAQSDTATGEWMTVLMQSNVEHSGELLAVTDSTVTLLVGKNVAEGRLADVRAIWVGERRRQALCITAARWCTPEDASDARLLSRYPYGLTPTAMAALLARTGQAAPAPLLAATP